MCVRGCVRCFLWGVMLYKINFTHVTLIPNMKEPTIMTQLRPIVYKICSKVLTNRLKSVLSNIISQTQSVFIPKRLVFDNRMAASKIVHFMDKKKNGWNGVMALKLDISKAYDHLSVIFLNKSYEKWGLPRSGST